MTDLAPQILEELREMNSRLAALERDRLMTTEEVAAYLGVCSKTLSAYVAKGILPEPAKVGAYRKWSLSAVREAPEKIRRLDGRRRPRP